MLSPLTVLSALFALIVMSACSVYFVRTHSVLSLALLVGSLGPCAIAVQYWLTTVISLRGALAVAGAVRSPVLPALGISGLVLNLVFAAAFFMLVLQQPRREPAESDVAGPA